VAYRVRRAADDHDEITAERLGAKLTGPMA
jgi:hypothetical protein